MITIKFTEDEIKELERERYEYPHPRIQKKIETVYLKSMGISPGDICRLCHISRPTFAEYLHAYQKEGIDGLKRWDYTGRSNELMKHSESLEAYFKKYPPMSSSQAIEEIEKLTGIRRSPTQIREFMKRIGMRFLKTGFVPKGVENELKQQEQDEFVKKKFKTNYKKQRKGSVWRFS